MTVQGSPIDLVILAAGASTRLGRPKQLLSYRGKTLLQHVIDTSIQADFNTRVLVLGANSDIIRNELKAGRMQVIVNEAWKDGLSSSIKSGLSGLLEINPDCQNVMFLLCDQPFLNSEILNELLTIHRSKTDAITVSKYDGQLGVPMIFSQPFFKKLLELEGDSGAKKIIMNHLEHVQSVSFEKGKYDIDTEEDYQKLIE